MAAAFAAERAAIKCEVSWRLWLTERETTEVGMDCPAMALERRSVSNFLRRNNKQVESGPPELPTAKVNVLNFKHEIR
jgi:hypothetical protein